MQTKKLAIFTLAAVLSFPVGLVISSAGQATAQVVTDTDGDGVDDATDQCLTSDLGATVVIGGCDSKVANSLFPNGCTASDLIANCAVGAKNHGKFVSCVSKLTNGLKRNELISGRQKGAIQRCAAQSDLP